MGANCEADLGTHTAQGRHQPYWTRPHREHATTLTPDGTGPGSTVPPRLKPAKMLSSLPTSFSGEQGTSARSLTSTECCRHQMCNGVCVAQIRTLQRQSAQYPATRRQSTACHQQPFRWLRGHAQRPPVAVPHGQPQCQLLAIPPSIASERRPILHRPIRIHYGSNTSHRAARAPANSAGSTPDQSANRKTPRASAAWCPRTPAGTTFSPASCGEVRRALTLVQLSAKRRWQPTL